MSEEALDAREVMRRVRAAKRAEQWLPLLPEELDALRSPMRQDPTLVALHDAWKFPDDLVPKRSGMAVKQRLVGPLRRIAYRVMAPYLSAERELLAGLIRANEALAERCDELARTIARRQSGEAENLAKLAAWLHEELDDPAGPAPGVSDRS
jgi:hypothetical protein